jgi:hypothetical protein
MSVWVMGWVLFSELGIKSFDFSSPVVGIARLLLALSLGSVGFGLVCLLQVSGVKKLGGLLLEMLLLSLFLGTLWFFTGIMILVADEL